MQPPNSGLWTKKDVAEYLQVCTRTVERMTESGKLPAIRLGSKLIRYRPGDVEAAVLKSGKKSLTG